MEWIGGAGQSLSLSFPSPPVCTCPVPICWCSVRLRRAYAHGASERCINIVFASLRTHISKSPGRRPYVRPLAYSRPAPPEDGLV